MTQTIAQSASIDQRTAAQKHNRVLLHALQIAHPVLYRQRQRFIQALSYSEIGGRIETVVYLTGDPTPLQPDEVTLAPEALSPLEQAQAAQTEAGENRK